MIDYLFSNWDFRKIYAEVPQFNAPMLGTAIDRIMDREGTCREHLFHGGVYWDVHTYSVARSHWEQLHQNDSLLARLNVDILATRPPQMESTVLDIDGFLTLVAETLEISVPAPETALRADGDVDSLALLELAVLVAELASISQDEFDWLPLTNSWTFRDLYLHYCTAVQLPPPSSR